MQLGMLLHRRLHEDRALLRIQTCSEPVRNSFEGGLADVLRIGVIGSERVPVGNEIEALIRVLKLDPVAYRSEVVAEVDAAGRTEAADDVLGLWIQIKLTGSLLDAGV